MLKTSLKKKVFIYLAIAGVIGGFVLGVLGIIPFVNLILVCVCFLLPLIAGGIGWYTVKAHEVPKSDLFGGLIIGALGGLVVGIPYSIISGFIGGVFKLIAGTAMTGLASLDQFGGNDFMMGSGTTAVAVFIGMIISFILTNIFMVILGSIGGILAASMNHVVVVKENSKE